MDIVIKRNNDVTFDGQLIGYISRPEFAGENWEFRSKRSKESIEEIKIRKKIFYFRSSAIVLKAKRLSDLVGLIEVNLPKLKVNDNFEKRNMERVFKKRNNENRLSFFKNS